MIQNTPRTHLLGVVPCIKCFKINFFSKNPKNQVHKFQNHFSENAGFLQSISKYPNLAILQFLVYFFKKCSSNNRLQHTWPSRNSHLPTYGPFSWSTSHIRLYLFLCVQQPSNFHLIYYFPNNLHNSNLHDF